MVHPVAPQRIDGAPPGEGHQPGARIGRNADPRPFGQGDDQRILNGPSMTVRPEPSDTMRLA